MSNMDQQHAVLTLNTIGSLSIRWNGAGYADTMNIPILGPGIVVKSDTIRSPIEGIFNRNFHNSHTEKKILSVVKNSHRSI